MLEILDRRLLVAICFQLTESCAQLQTYKGEENQVMCKDAMRQLSRDGLIQALGLCEGIESVSR